MQRLAFILLSLQGLALTAALGIQERQTQGGTPIIPCSSLTAPAVPGATVLSMKAAEVRDFDTNIHRQRPEGFPSGPTNTTVAPVSFCDVNVTLTHGNDSVLVEVWLPLTGWNGRFQGTGGSGFIAGGFAPLLGPELAAGYVAASTDAGLRPVSFDGTGIKFDQQLLENFASLSVHELAVIGKNLTQAFYGKPPSFSYWNGCATGGRQGYMEAQRFPEDFNGILAAAPAINWAKFMTAEMWPFVVQNSDNDFVPQCAVDTIVAGHIADCDKDDGAEDGLISDPQSCRFDAKTMLGTNFSCNGTTGKVTQQQIDVYNKILSGPTSQNGTQLWFGLFPGANPDVLSQKQPFSLASGWINNLVAKSNAAQTMTTANFSNMFAASEVQFGTLLNTDSPDLTAFKSAGGKLLTWQGYSDQLIPPEGTINYRQKVEALMGGSDRVDSFYRLFFAPGVGNCAGGTGPEPASVLDALVGWVEKGVAPDTLSARTNDSKVTRNLCRYPLSLNYRGNGDISKAESWNCVRTNISQSQAYPPSSRPDGSQESSARSVGANFAQVVSFAVGVALMSMSSCTW